MIPSDTLGQRKLRRTSERLQSYNFVSPDTRVTLIRMVEVEKVRIKVASTKLDINYSTAKSIIRKFRHTGISTSMKNEF
jgi:transposase